MTAIHIEGVNDRMRNHRAFYRYAILAVLFSLFCRPAELYANELLQRLEQVVKEWQALDQSILGFVDEVEKEEFYFAKKGLSKQKGLLFDPKQHNFFVAIRQDSEERTKAWLIAGFPTKKADRWETARRLVVNVDGEALHFNLQSYEMRFHEEKNRVFQYYELPATSLLRILLPVSHGKKVVVRYADDESEKFVDFELTRDQIDGLRDILRYQALLDAARFFKEQSEQAENNDDFFEESDWNTTNTVQAVYEMTEAYFSTGIFYPQDKWKEARPIDFTSVSDAACRIKTYYAPNQVIQFAEVSYQGDDTEFMLRYDSESFYFDIMGKFLVPGITMQETVDFFQELPSEFEENSMWYSYGVGAFVTLDFEDYRLKRVLVHSGSNEEFPEAVDAVFDYKWKK